MLIWRSCALCTSVRYALAPMLGGPINGSTDKVTARNSD